MLYLALVRGSLIRIINYVKNAYQDYRDYEVTFNYVVRNYDFQLIDQA